MALLAPSPTVNPYTAAADLIDALPTLMKRERLESGISLKTQAAQVGVGSTTLTRLESGSVPTATTIVRCLRWLAVAA